MRSNGEQMRIPRFVLSSVFVDFALMICVVAPWTLLQVNERVSDVAASSSF